MIHASRIDGHIDPAELAARDRLLKQKFDLVDARDGGNQMQDESDQQKGDNPILPDPSQGLSQGEIHG